MTRYFVPLFILPLFLMFLGAGGVSHAKTLPSGNYDCTPSVVFQFDETDE